MTKRQNLLARFVLAATAFATTNSAQATEWEIVPEASTLSFEATQTGSAFRGQFRRFNADINLDPEDLSTASISATIQTSSFSSGSADRDTDAVDIHWFHTTAFPQATFTSSEIVQGEDNGYVAIGTLTIKSFEQAVELPFTLDIDGDRAVADGSITLDRIDFDLGASGEVSDDSFIGHQVVVTLHIEATRAD